MKRAALLRHTPLRSTDRLRATGRRGRRLRSADRRQEEITHHLPCVCGCGATVGEVARAHLVGRAAESLRNEDHNNLPACWWLGEWLDHTADGVNCKRSMQALAIGMGRRLEARDVQPLLREWGYYEWRRRAGGGTR